MLFERFEVPGLAHYSYIVGSAATREIAVVDPKRDIADYLNFAKQHQLKITHVLETHIHADYASGAKQLAKACGAKLCLSAYDKNEQYEVAYSHEKIFDGDRIMLGEVSLQALHTPGHTPEHLAFLVSTSPAHQPELMLSGDFLFVGSVGRPDLLGESNTAKLAQQLYQSVQKLTSLPDSLKIYPAHGAGSMCGSGLGSACSSTLGQERQNNPYLKGNLTQERFIDTVLSNLPPLPPYYLRMKELNSKGPADLNLQSSVNELSAEQVEKLRQSGAVLVDLRTAAEFCAAHIPDSLSIGWGASFVTWASWVLPDNTAFIMVCADSHIALQATQALARVGFDRVQGFISIEKWSAVNKALRSIPQLTVQQLAEQLAHNKKLKVLDVRSDAEWRAGHIQSATHIICSELAEKISQVPASPELAIICGSGYRSTISCSLLARAGHSNMVNVIGGMTAWNEAQLSHSQ